MTEHVLFVDDEEANLVVCEAVCADEFSVLTANTAESALALLAQHDVAVIISDQRMPHMTGVQLLERTRELFPDTVRLLITAYSDLPAAIDAINRGHVRRYLRKPFQPDELKAELRDALDVYRTKRRLEDLERRLHDSERIYALGVLVAGLAHELRNPLGWVSGNVAVARQAVSEVEHQLGEATPDLERVRSEIRDSCEALEDAATGARRIADIVESVQLAARPPRLQDEIVALDEVVTTTLRLVRGELRQVAALEIDLTAGMRVRGASTKISQIVLNLVVNAMQAFAGRPRETNLIAVRVAEQGNSACLEVRDNGPGISPQNLTRIFELFFTTKPNSGTGLGLAISKRIAEELGGQLEVESAVGEGARFRLLLPRM
jgi:two-component system sensor histidine kinase/response regulator